ncbi:hypothetical protein Bca4012_053278 [Brassica carinata]
MQGALPLGENLEKRGMRANTRCCSCGEIETAMHCFVHCPFTVNIWELAPVLNKPNFVAITNFAICLQSSKRLICLPPTGLTSANIFQWLCWAIWIARNKRIFENRTTSAEDVISKAVSEVAEWKRAQLTEKDPATAASTVTSNCTTTRNLTNHTKVCTDAAWNESRQTAGLGWFFSDQLRPSFHQGSKTEVFVKSPLIAEALAIRQALETARHMVVTNLLVNSDSQTLVRTIQQKSFVKEHMGILQDIYEFSCCFSSIFFSFIPRGENSVADSIANQALYSSDAL